MNSNQDNEGLNGEMFAVFLPWWQRRQGITEEVVADEDVVIF